MLKAHQHPHCLTPAPCISASLNAKLVRTRPTRKPASAARSAASTLAQPASLGNLHQLGAPPLRYRSIFISDLHLGTPAAQADVLLDFLTTVQTDTLYLVGDILDGWKLKINWYWPDSHTAVLQQLYELARRGTRVCYVPGNHDEAARAYLTDEAVTIGNVEVVQETMHTCADGRRFLVLHGDRCDTSVHLSSALTRALGDWVYDQFVNLNILIKATRRFLRLPYWSLAAHVNGNSRFAIEMVSRYEEALANEAKRLGVDGVICGHIHKPVIRRIDDVIYVNDGDWVDSCSALVEDFNGQLEIIYWQPIYEQRQQERARLQRAAAAPPAAAGNEPEEGAAADAAPPSTSGAAPAPASPDAAQQHQGRAERHGDKQAVDLALRIMIGSSVPHKRRLGQERQAQPGGRGR